MILARRLKINPLDSSTALQLHNILTLDSHDIIEPSVVDATERTGFWRMKIVAYCSLHFIVLHTDALCNAAIFDGTNDL